MIFVGAEFAKTHGTSCVQAVGGDADFGAEAELEAVGESGAGIPVGGGGVDGSEEAFGSDFICGDDGVAMTTSVTVYRVDGGTGCLHLPGPRSFH